MPKNHPRSKKLQNGEAKVKRKQQKKSRVCFQNKQTGQQ
jgi:hypothetical protein